MPTLTTYGPAGYDPDVPGGNVVSIEDVPDSPPNVIPDWRPPGVLTRLEFLRRLTPAERIAARAASDPVIDDFLALLQLAEHVDVGDADTVAGVGYLASVGVLTEARAAEVLSVEA